MTIEVKNRTQNPFRDKKAKLFDAVFDTIIYVLVSFGILVCLLPFVYMVALSFSSNRAINAREVFLWPVEFDLLNYYKVFNDPMIYSSFFSSVKVTVLLTGIAMIMTVLCAYPLSKTRLRGRKLIMGMILFTMMFSGGMVPSYLLVSNLKLLNNHWALILPCCLSTYNMIILRTFFKNSIPPNIEEAALIDGCNELQTLFRVVLPLSTPVLATLALFYAVSRWNGFQDAKLYITRSELFVMPQKINHIITNNALSSQQMINDPELMDRTATSEGIKSASIVVTIAPILAVYPWLQKYFVRGVTLGSVKE
jgi:putative aldouronate transport system permease protein